MAPLYKHILIVALLALMSHRILARHVYGPIYFRQEVMTDDDMDNSEEFMNELRVPAEMDSNYLPQWAILREMVPEPLPTPLPQKRMLPPQAHFNAVKQVNKKDSTLKGRSDYAVQCSFKICNLGRKRSLRLIRY